MPSSWDSMPLDTMARWHVYLQIATLVLGLLTAAGAALVWRTGARLDAVRAARHETDRRRLESDNERLRSELEATRPPASPSSPQAGDLRPDQGPRRVGAEARAKVVSMLRASEVCSIEVLAVKGDAESVTFATELADVVKEAGWTTGAVQETNFKDEPAGLFLVVHSAETAPRCAGHMQQALDAAGFPAQGEAHKDRRVGSLTLVVGRRP